MIEFNALIAVLETASDNKFVPNPIYDYYYRVCLKSFLLFSI
jgi:hypothetical protein